MLKLPASIAAIGFLLCILSCEILDTSDKNAATWKVNNPAHPANVPYSDIMDKYTKRGVPGIAVGVNYALDGTWIGVGGKADLSTGRDVEFDSVFNAAAISHLFTSVIACQLMEEGKLPFSSIIGNFLPKEARKKIQNANITTIGQLVKYECDFYDYALDVSFGLALLASPGKKWMPSDILPFVYDKNASGQDPHGFNATVDILLQVCIEKIEKMPIGLSILNRIIYPLGLSHTIFGYDSAKASLVPSYISFTEGHLVENVSIYAGYYTADGGVFSNVEDACTFLRDVASGSAGTLINDTSLSLLPELDFSLSTPSFTSFARVAQDGSIYVVFYNAGLGRIGNLVWLGVEHEFPEN